MTDPASLSTVVRQNSHTARTELVDLNSIEAPQLGQGTCCMTGRSSSNELLQNLRLGRIELGGRDQSLVEQRLQLAEPRFGVQRRRRRVRPRSAWSAESL